MKTLKKLVAATSALAVASCSLAFTACENNNDEQLTETRQFIQNAVSVTQSANYKSAVLDGSVSMSGTGGVALSNVSASIDGVIDLSTMDCDMEAVMTDPYQGTSYGYIFLREMQFFASSDTFTSRQTDYSGMALAAVADNWMAVSLSSASAAADFQTVFAAATLAECYNAATLADNCLTINTLALVKGIYDDMIEIVNALTAETTISDVYSHDLFKNVLGSVGEVLSAQEAYEAVFQLFELAVGSNSSAADVQFPLPRPEEGQSLYDYIGSVLNSEEVADSLGIGQPIGGMGVVDLINAGNTSDPVTVQDLKAVIAAVTQYISFENGFTIYADGVQLNISGCDMVFSFNDDGALSGIETDCSVTSSYAGDSISLSMSMALEYSAADAVLADIGSNPVNVGGVAMTVNDYLAILGSLY